MTINGSSEPQVEDKPQSKTFKEGVITLLDVLGWKGKTNINSMYNLWDIISENKVNDITKQYSKFTEKGENIETKVISISDTIIFYTFCDPLNYGIVLELHGEIASDFLIRGLERNILFRGATSLGEFQTKENIFIGPAVDEAASWYERSNWIGIIMSPSAYFKYKKPVNIQTYWIGHDPELKNMRPRLTLCVNWVRESKYNTEYMKEYFSQFCPITPEISSKYDNTINFVKKIAESTLEK